MRMNRSHKAPFIQLGKPTRSFEAGVCSVEILCLTFFFLLLGTQTNAKMKNVFHNVTDG